MFVSQKSQYALRAVFELARRASDRPAKIADIANAQAIPPRFLEVILSQLKQAGFVESRRGKEGGYLLARDPETLSVGDVLEFVQGPVVPIDCTDPHSTQRCSLEHGNADCVFHPMWMQVQREVQSVFNRTTFSDLVRQDQQREKTYVPMYSI